MRTPPREGRRRELGPRLCTAAPTRARTRWAKGTGVSATGGRVHFYVLMHGTTTYKEVCTGSTNHAEVVKLDFDEKIISYEKILNIFFEIHDPTTLNSQGPDFGTQYRSEIFYLNDNQKNIAEKVLNETNKKLSGRVVTKITLLNNYCAAEEYHQKYLEKR